MIPYKTVEEIAKDDSYIGKRTERFYIRPFFRGQSDDIKGFSIIGEEDGWKNVEKIGLYSSTYGVLVEPSRHIISRRMDMDFDHQLLDVEDGKLSIEYAKAEKRAMDDSSIASIMRGTALDRARYFDWLYKKCRDEHVASNINYYEIQAFLEDRLANNSKLAPATFEELFTFIKELRNQTYNMTSTENQKTL